MKKLTYIIISIALFVNGCDIFDGTGTTNPDLTIDRTLGQPNTPDAWVNGLLEQSASTYNQYMVSAELATDNYINLETFFNQNVDGGTYRDIDDDFDDTQSAIATLRENATFGLNTIIPDAELTNSPLEAEMHFHKGLANILAGELFTALPPSSDTLAVEPRVFFNTAIEDFQNAIDASDSDPDADIGYRIALARAHYNLGNQSEAVSVSQNVIAADPGKDFVRFLQFDGVNGPTNTLQNAVFDRASFDDLQPLPRLDFLDPKYGEQGDQESPIPMMKVEEAYLIIAEAQLADNDLPGAQQTMLDLLDVVDSRPTRDFNETAEDRGKDDAQKVNRPDNTNFEVRASSNDPFKENLVLERTAATTVPTVSGTSVTADDINNLTDASGDALELLYLMRQEIFFGEGRRMVDLGIRWPVSETEALNNESITDADRQATIPSYLQPIDEVAPDMDSFTVDSTSVTISTNYNSVIAQQRGNIFQ